MQPIAQNPDSSLLSRWPRLRSVLEWVLVGLIPGLALGLLAVRAGTPFGDFETAGNVGRAVTLGWALAFSRVPRSWMELGGCLLTAAVLIPVTFYVYRWLW